MMLILGLLGMYFDAAVVFFKTSSFLFRLALTILCPKNLRNKIRRMLEDLGFCSNASLELKYLPSWSICKLEIWFPICESEFTYHQGSGLKTRIHARYQARHIIYQLKISSMNLWLNSQPIKNLDSESGILWFVGYPQIWGGKFKLIGSRDKPDISYKDSRGYCSRGEQQRVQPFRATPWFTECQVK